MINRHIVIKDVKKILLKTLIKMKVYMKRSTKEKTTENKRDYKRKLLQHRRAAFLRFMFVFAVLGVLAVVVYMQYKSHIYSDYEYISVKTVNRVVNSKSVQLGEYILTYSNDGAHCTDTNGVELWNQTYQMQNPIVKISGDVVAIADYNGREVYIYNTREKICQLNMTMAIKNIAVASNGRTAVEVINGRETWIYVYDPDGKAYFEKRTTMGQSGYPAAFSFSPNGELLAMSCIFVDAGTVKSQIAFYNMGPVGENKANSEVNAYTYQDVIIPYIEFMNNGMAVAVGDDRMLFYEGDQIPTFSTMHMFDDEVQSVYQKDDHLGVLFRSDVLEMRNKMVVYDASSKKVGTYYFNTAFHDIVFTSSYFVAYGDSECTIITYDDVEKFEGRFDRTVDLMLPVGKGYGYKFVLVSGNTFNVIQMQ